MCRAICSPMAPRPTIPVRLSVLVTWSIPVLDVTRCSTRLCLRPAARSRRFVDHPDAGVLAQDDSIVPFGRLRRYMTFAHIGQHALGIALERIAIAAAARRVEPERVAGLERIIG